MHRNQTLSVTDRGNLNELYILIRYIVLLLIETRPQSRRLILRRTTAAGSGGRPSVKTIWVRNDILAHAITRLAGVEFAIAAVKYIKSNLHLERSVLYVVVRYILQQRGMHT